LLISFPSIASLFLIFQSAQLWTAKVNQASLRRDPERLWTNAMSCPAPAGFQSHCRSSLAPAHANLARWHEKKIWLQSSSSPQKAHAPVVGPFLLSTCTPDGSRLLMSCHRKTLILGGTLVFQTSLKCVTAAPCDMRP
jgi:hypothetical protein